MSKLSSTATILLLLQIAATYAAPNVVPSQPQPVTPATATKVESLAVTATFIASENYQADLKARAIADPLAKRLDSSFTVANTFTSLNASLTLPGTAMLTSSTSTSAGPMAIGSFTGADGGVYEVTSQSGYVVIDGKTLAPGQNALIGNGIVTDGAGGLVANGQTVALSAVTMTIEEVSATTAATSASAQTSIVQSSAASPTATASSSGASAASAAGSSSSAKAAAATNAAGKFVAVAGVVGLMLL